MSDAYDMIDRFLRNNLGSDDDYAEYSKALDSLCGAQPAQAGQVLTDEEIGEIRWQCRWNRMSTEDPDMYACKAQVDTFARAIEQAVLAKRVPMTESAWQNPLHPDQISDKPIPNWTPLYRLMGKISDQSNAQHFSAEAAVKAFCTVGEKGGA